MKNELGMSKTEALKWCLSAVVRSLDSGVVHVNYFEESEKKYSKVQEVSSLYLMVKNIYPLLNF